MHYLNWGYAPCVYLSLDGFAFLFLSFLVFQQLRKMHYSLKTNAPPNTQIIGSVAPGLARSHFVDPMGVGSFGGPVGRLTSLGTLEYDSHTSTRLNLSGGQTRFSFILLLFASTVGEIHSSFAAKKLVLTVWVGRAVFEALPWVATVFICM